MASDLYVCLQSAARNNQIDAARLCIDRGDSVDGFDPSGDTPLQLACRATLLFDRNSRRRPEGSARLVTPLHVACARGHSDVATAAPTWIRRGCTV